MPKGFRLKIHRYIEVEPIIRRLAKPEKKRTFAKNIRMSSLKEIKGRIGSVKSTQKITSAMKMVASAKLRKTQSNLECFLPYEQQLAKILQRFVESNVGELNSPLTEVRRPRRVAIVALSSNSSLCGAFNSNVIKPFTETFAKYYAEGCEIDIYPVGKK
jgi:F-type H+-transporting ATPase subunit gamma